MYQYSINLSGRVKNFPLPKHQPLVPLYEAVVNSLHAIEERKSLDSSYQNGKIIIDVIRSKQVTMKDELSPVESFIVTDNGVGFTEQNMKSFLESDSTYKAQIGGKGVGRFSWLKAFSSVNVSSTYKDDGRFLKRDFIFSLDNSLINDTLLECEQASDHSTVITLNTYLHDYKKDVPKQIETIAMRIIQHCLVYFLDNDCPIIIIKDDNDRVFLNQLFRDKFKTEDNVVNFSVNEKSFSLLSVRIGEKSFSGNRLYLCANNRLVADKDLETHITDLDGQIFNRDGFWYVGVLTSNYLDDRVDMNRLSFNIPESGTNLINEISFEEIIRESCKHIENYLSDYLMPITEEKTRRIREYVTIDAPQFRHLLKYMSDEMAKIKPKVSGDKLDDALYDIKRSFDKKNKKELKQLFEQLDESNMTQDEYERFFKVQVEKISDANSSVLAEYVAHRRVIIELLERGLRRQENGKFNKERYLHSLIYPMNNTADEIDYEAHNLWLIDEKLSYCNYISSDIPFDNDYSQKRTDVLILDNPVAVSDDKNDGTIFDTIIIFELKRPMRDDYTDSDNPITQLYDYVRKIRSGEAKDKYHRPIKVNDSTKYYLYAVCDVTSKLERFIEQHSFTPTPDSLGYFKFNKTYNAYFEVLSYDKILNDAKKRNRVLFDKLGI